MSAVRINITLPEEVVKKLNKMTKQRERSAYIAAALDFYQKHQHKKNLMEEMIEGYLKTHGESSELNQDFDSASLDRWED